MTTLEHLKAKAEAAREEFERVYGQLFCDAEQQGKLYSDAEHEVRLRALQRDRRVAAGERPLPRCPSLRWARDDRAADGVPDRLSISLAHGVSFGLTGSTEGDRGCCSKKGARRVQDCLRGVR